MSEQMPSVGDLIQHINSLVWNGICSKVRGPQADMLGFRWSCSSRSIHRSNQRGFIITYINHCPFMCMIEYEYILRLWILSQCFHPEDCYQNVSFTADPLLPTGLLHTINLHILQSEPLSHHHHHPHHPIRSAVSTSLVSSQTGKILLDHESSHNAKC